MWFTKGGIKLEIDKLKFKIDQIKRVYEKNQKSKKINEYDIYLQKCISKIHSTFINDWEIDQLPIVNNCFNNLKKGIPLPVLSICGRGTREIRFTKYFAYYLDQFNPHGLGPSYLREVLKIDGVNAEKYCEILKKLNVESEVYIGSVPGKVGLVSCFCDITIENEDFVFIVLKVCIVTQGHLN